MTIGITLYHAQKGELAIKVKNGSREDRDRMREIFESNNYSVSAYQGQDDVLYVNPADAVRNGVYASSDGRLGLTTQDDFLSFQRVFQGGLPVNIQAVSDREDAPRVGFFDRQILPYSPGNRNYSLDLEVHRISEKSFPSHSPYNNGAHALQGGHQNQH